MNYWYVRLSMVLEKGLEPLRPAASDPKSDASAIPPPKRIFYYSDPSSFFSLEQSYLHIGAIFARVFTEQRSLKNFFYLYKVFNKRVTLQTYVAVPMMVEMKI